MDSKLYINVRYILIIGSQNMSVIVEPGRPGGPLVISDIQSDSVHLSWKPPSEDGGGTILGYLIEAKDVLHVDIHKTYIWTDGPQTEFDVKGLQTSHIYQFRIYAQNEAGRGEALLNKKVIRIKAASKKPPSTSKPSVAIQDEESLMLHWSVPEGLSDVNYIIEKYESKSGLWMQCNHDLVIRNSYLVTGLLAEKEYKFRITCENAYGISVPSEESDLVILQGSEGEPPTVMVPLTDCLVKIEDAASFSCEYSGSQPILVNWTKDGIRVREGFGASIATEKTKSTLTLEEVESDDDECSVQCDLRNSEGKASSQAKIKIQSPPKITSSSSYKEGLTYDEGDNLRLKVNFTGKPRPIIKWFFNGKEPILSDRTEISFEDESIEVRICELKHIDAGSYEFVAENDMGSDTLLVKVTVTGSPSPPAGFPTLEVLSEDETVLKWSSPLKDGGSSIFNYIVEILQPENQEWKHFATVHDTILRISDTVQEKSLFRIRAVNIYGASEPSEECRYKASVEDIKILREHLSQPESLDMKDSVDAYRKEIHIDNDIKESLQLLYNDENVANETQERNIDNSRYEEDNTLVHIKDIDSTGSPDYLAMLSETMDSNKESLLAMNYSRISNEIISEETETIQTSRISDENDYIHKIDIIEEIIDQSDLEAITEMCFGINENIKRAISVVEIQEYEPTPLSVLYVGTQISISIPTFNFVSSDVQDFEEIMHFAAEVIPIEEYLIQSIDHILCYTNCSFTTVLENVQPDDFKLSESVPILNCTLHFHDYHLENHLHSCYDCEIGEFYDLNFLTDRAFCIENSTDILDVSEKVCIDILFPKFVGINSIKHLQQYNHKEAILMSCHPWILESFQPIISAIIFKHNLTVSYELNNSIVIFLPIILYSSTTFETSDKLIRASSVTHIPDELETLAGLKCVPITSHKPALSVLPMSRCIQVDMSKRDKNRNCNVSQSENSKLFLENNSLSTRTLDLDDTFKGISEICRNCSSDTCVCSLLKEYERNLMNNDIVVNNSRTSELSEFDKEHEKKNILSSSNICGSDNIPDWLRLVSPFHFSTNKKSSEETIFNFGEDKLLPKELSTQSIATKIHFKDRSVQDLLNLAEEVEKSFSQKAEHFESLENVLQEELSSLEKDLEAVHKIHQTFWDDAQMPWKTSCSYDSKISFEKDLIDFKKDVPLVKPQEMKQEGYAPEVLTHLHNRVVQCGCRTRLYCSISGKPDPQIAWLKNGKLLSKNCRYVCSNLVEFGLYVDIYNAKSSDCGEYMCIATNCHGSAQTQAYLRVVGEREYSPEKPRFLTTPDDITVSAGESVTLEWKIAGTPIPHVMWFKNAERIETDLRRDATNNHRGLCRLALHNLRIEDGAIYTCYLENESGSSVSTVLVSVADEGQQQYFEDSVDTSSNAINFLNLTDDDPDIPSLQYYEKFLNQRTNRPSSGTSVRTKTRPHKRTKTAPCLPFAPSILNSGKTWVILSWSAPIDSIGKTSGLVYLLERRLLDGNNWTEVGQTPNTMYTAAGLKIGQSYVFRISAGNSDGWGPPVTLTQPVHCSRDSRTMAKNKDQIYSNV